MTEFQEDVADLVNAFKAKPRKNVTKPPAPAAPPASLTPEPAAPEPATPPAAPRADTRAAGGPKTVSPPRTPEPPKAAPTRRTTPKKAPARPAPTSTTGNRPWSVKLDRDVSALLDPACRSWSQTLTGLILRAAEEYHDQAADLSDAPDYTEVTGTLFPRAVRQPKRRQTHHAYLSEAEKDTLDQVARNAGLDRSTFCSRTLRAVLARRVFLPAQRLARVASAPDPADALLERVQALAGSRLATIPDGNQPWAEFPAEWVGERLATTLDEAVARLRATSWTEVALTALGGAG